VSELRKRTPDPHVLAWHSRQVDTDAYLSVLVVGEIRQGMGARVLNPFERR
jgi:predicted nucleic acid-binding protein